MPFPVLRPLVFVGASSKDYGRFPREVLREMGYQLYLVQAGVKAPGEQPLSRGSLKGLGIREIRDDFDRDTFRVVYTVKLTHAVYVLHAFKKKSKFGISTPTHDIDLVRQRYREALALDAAYLSPPTGDPVR
jgi:phage-related protein